MMQDDLHLSICKNVTFALQNNRKNDCSAERERKSRRGHRSSSGISEGSGETEEEG
jgi:hypothetical protein